MRFHRLRIQNLNSLYGGGDEEEDFQEIDFDEGLGGASLFLIMGPTGAGKTSILDGICLALFGSVPRQRGVRKGEDIAEQIMSRGPGVLNVSLEFSRRSQSADQRLLYRAGWYCNRARKKAAGKLQTPRRSLDRWDGELGQWKAVAGDTVQDRYQPAFDEALSKMTLEDFLRSVLLAQGEFRAFLDADVKDKATILEKLTRTEEYEKIGARAAARYGREKQALKEARARLEGIELRSDEEVRELKEQEGVLKGEVEALRKVIEAMEAVLEWWKGARDRKAALQAAEEAREAFQVEWESSANERGRWEEYSVARDALGVLERVEEKEAARDKREEELRELEERLPGLDEARAQAAEAEVLGTQALKEAKEAWEARRPEVLAARDLRQRYAGKDEELQAARGVRQRAEEQTKKKREELDGLREKLEALQQDEEESAGGREAIRQEREQGLAELKGLEERLRNIDAQEKRVVDLTGKEERLGALRAGLAALEKELEVWAEKAGEAKELAERLLGQRETLEKLLQARTDRVSLVEERRRLTSGEPCPVCGSEEHPWAGLRGEEEAKFLAELEETREEHRELEAQGRKAEAAGREAEKEVATRQGRRETEIRQVEELEAEVVELRGVVEAAAIVLGPAEEGLAELRRVAESAITARKGALDGLDRREEVLDRVEKLSAEVKASEEVLKEREVAWTEAQERAAELESAVEKLREDVAKSLNGESPDEVERRLTGVVDQAQERLQALQKAHEERVREKDLAEKGREGLKRQLAELKEELRVLGEALARGLEGLELSSREELRARRVPGEEREELEARVATWKARHAELETGRKNAREALEAHLKSRPEELVGVDEGAPEEFLRREEALQEERTTLEAKHRDLGVVQERLKEDGEQRGRFAKLKARVDVVEEEEQRWRVIHDLIGAGDRKRFQVFAQALNLERIVEEANGQLEHLYPRYRLDVARESDGLPTLEFAVVDQYDPSRLAKVSTLSGGEGFLVSLALALALAEMRQLEMPLETLLLDEGFGTLDQESLQQAVAVLRGLHSRDGRQVGVISHVEGLKEEIDARILVERTGEGRSKIRVVQKE